MNNQKYMRRSNRKKSMLRSVNPLDPKDKVTNSAEIDFLKVAAPRNKSRKIDDKIAMEISS